MTPKFTIGKSDKVYISDKFLCTGHWLCTREIAQSHVAPKALKPLLSLQIGCYDSGISSGKTRDEKGLPDFAQVIPKRDGYLPVQFDPIGVEFCGQDSDEIRAYKYQNRAEVKAGETDSNFVFGAQQQYVPLLRMGHVFAKDALSPIIVLGGDSLNDELLAVVMPYRLFERAI